MTRETVESHSVRTRSGEDPSPKAGADAGSSDALGVCYGVMRHVPSWRDVGATGVAGFRVAAERRVTTGRRLG